LPRYSSLLRDKKKRKKGNSGTITDIYQNIVLSQKPPITTTMTSLPPALLEQLLAELSTLASVYHKPPESFVGKGRFGADEIQRAAIQEQRQNAAENPIAASVAAARNGTPAQSNIENLLDIDFDGAAPASQEQNSAAATPERMASPIGGAGQSGGMADMMGLFDAPTPAQNNAMSPGSANDMMAGFAGLDLGGSNQPPPASVQLGYASQDQKKNANDDLLGLF
jgi:AP-1 complex subunit beta-1